MARERVLLSEFQAVNMSLGFSLTTVMLYISSRFGSIPSFDLLYYSCIGFRLSTHQSIDLPNPCQLGLVLARPLERPMEQYSQRLGSHSD